MFVCLFTGCVCSRAFWFARASGDSENRRYATCPSERRSAAFSLRPVASGSRMRRRPRAQRHVRNALTLTHTGRQWHCIACGMTCVGVHRLGSPPAAACDGGGLSLFVAPAASAPTPFRRGVGSVGDRAPLQTRRCGGSAAQGGSLINPARRRRPTRRCTLRDGTADGTPRPLRARKPSPGADVAGVGPSPSADVAGVGPVPAQMWQG